MKTIFLLKMEKIDNKVKKNTQLQVSEKAFFRVIVK